MAHTIDQKALQEMLKNKEITLAEYKAAMDYKEDKTDEECLLEETKRIREILETSIKTPSKDIDIKAILDVFKQSIEKIITKKEDVKPIENKKKETWDFEIEWDDGRTAQIKGREL